MRKLFTKLSSVLVLLLLSVQVIFAQPQIATDGLNPADGATVEPGITTFTMTFDGDVYPGNGGAIGLYTNAGALMRVFQVNGANTVAPSGKATFDGNTVTIEFPGVTFDESSLYYVTVENKAIKDAGGVNYVPADVFGAPAQWNFTIADTKAPVVDDSNPENGEDGVNPSLNVFTVEFSENVTFEGGATTYSPALGDVALYMAANNQAGQEEGDLISLNAPTLSISGNELTIDWGTSFTLPVYSDLYVRIKKDIIVDAAGNPFAGFNNNTGWAFSTRAMDTYEPVVKAWSADGLTEYASGALWTNSIFTIEFTEAIYLIDGTAIDTDAKLNDLLADEISLLADGEAIDFDMEFDGFNIVLTPENELEGAEFTVNMNGGVVRYVNGTQSEAVSETFEGGDWLAPEITFFTDSHGGTYFDIWAESNEDATIKYIVVERDAPAPTVADIIGYSATGTGTSGSGTSLRTHRLNDDFTLSYGIGLTTVTEVEIFAEGTMAVNQGAESIKRVSGLPATHGAEYMVYAVAYDASTTGVYSPDYSSPGTEPAIEGNISGIGSAEAHTIDILMPSVWFDGPDTDGDLLNEDEEDPVTLGAPLAVLDKNGSIYINFNEAVRLVSGAPVTNASINSFVQLRDVTNSTTLAYTASYSASTDQIVINANRSFRSGATIEVEILAAMIEDEAGNEYQPSDADLRIQEFTVEEYNPVLAWFEPADGVGASDPTEFRENKITVKFNDIVYAPAGDTGGQLVRLNNDPTSNLFVGKYFDVREGNGTAADNTSTPVKDEFSYTVSYDNTNKITTVVIERISGDWLSENFYYVEIEANLLDANYYTLADGAGITAASTPARTDVEPFDVETTQGNNNVSMSFKYGDVRSPEITFFAYNETAALPATLPFDELDLIHLDGNNDVAESELIGVYVDEYVMLGFADEIDFIAPDAPLTAPVDGNAFRRYFSLESEGEAISFDIEVVYIDETNDVMFLTLNPYYPSNGGFEEAENFNAGVEYTVEYISTQLEGNLGEAYQDKYDNKVVAGAKATFSGATTPTTPTISAEYTPEHEEVVSAAISEIVITFDGFAVDGTIPNITLTEVSTGDNVALTGTASNLFRTITYSIPANTFVISGSLKETEEYTVTVAANAFSFLETSVQWPTPVGADSIWTFSTVDGTPPAIVDLGGGVLDLTPANGATGVGLDTDLVIEYDEDVFKVAGKKLFIWKASTQTEISTSGYDASIFDVDESTVTLDNSWFGHLLEYNTEYYVTIQPGFVKDASENTSAQLASTTAWRFTTGVDPEPSYASFYPEFESLDTETSFSVTFTEAVDPVNNTWIYLYRLDPNPATPIEKHKWQADDASVVASNGKKTYTFKPEATDISLGGTYSIVIEQGAFVDADGNDIYPVAQSSSLALGQTDVGAVGGPDATWVVYFGDTEAPELTFWPEDEEVHIPYNAFLYVKFSEPMFLKNGPVISVDPTLIADNIASFFTLTPSGGSPVDLLVEFVDAAKTIVRITPMDPAGHNYDASEDNPTMATETTYVLSVSDNNGTYELSDASGNVITPVTNEFTTEDITAPVLASVSADAACSPNSVKVTFDVDEDAKVWVYVVEGTPSAAPSVADIKANAQWSDDDVTVGTGIETDEIDLDETVGATEFTAYIVAEDHEVDVYANPDADMWIFTETGDGVNRIRDIIAAPNVSTVESATFVVADNDAPYVVSKSPEHEETWVALDAVIEIEFNEQIAYQPNALTPDNVWLRKASNNAAVDITVSLAGGDSILVITPDVPLQEETDYYVEIDRYAVYDVATCGANMFGEWVGKENLRFSTVDNTAPVVLAYYPLIGADCIPTDLEYARVYLTETNELKKADDGVIVIQHDGVDAQTIDFGSDYVTFGEDEDGKYVEISLVDFILLPDTDITINIPAGVIGDEYDNVLASPISWTFTTIDDIAPIVSWTLFEWETYFNNSDPSEVGVSKFNSEFATGLEGDVAASAPTHSILKIEFDENIVMKAGNEWLTLGDYDAAILSNATNRNTDGKLSRAEIFANIKIGDLAYDDDEDDSNLIIYEVGVDYIVIGMKELVSNLLVEADEDGTSVTKGFDAGATDYYGSLLSETVYDVSILANTIADPLKCTGQEDYVIRTDEVQVVSIDTRDDVAPELTFSGCEDDCVTADGAIKLSFDKPVVKSSYDIAWLGTENLTKANMMLTAADLSHTGTGRYIEFFELDASDNRIGAPIEVKDVVVDANMMDIYLTPATPLKSNTNYEIEFNKWTVKRYIDENTSTGTIFEGASCIFHVFDYEAPEVAAALSPADGDSNLTTQIDELVIVFDEKIQKGTGMVTIRRENGSIFEEIDINDPAVTITPATGASAKRTLTIPFQSHEALEDFTMYYVEMAEGVITDTVACALNPFAGFGAQLASDGELVSADWSFSTSDGTPPQLKADLDGNLIGLSPEPGYENVPKNANLILWFDENIQINTTATAGLVIYYNNGDEPIPAPGESGDFGNAIEFIPWNSNRITISGSDIYNGFDFDVITVDPVTTFEATGTYYVRVAGNNVQDIAGNLWSASENELLNQVTDYEWYFTITNDVAPVLVATNPVYDGVEAPDVYEELTSEELDYAKVVATLSMTFEDGNGNALDVVKGDAGRFFDVREYYYNPVTAQFEDSIWLRLPITDESITVSGNVVTVNDVELRDGINGDNFYFITVSSGAILNGIEGSQTWWPGIANAFRWRFHTASDEVFVDGYEILSPNRITDNEAAEGLTLEEASVLQVEFNEGVSILDTPIGAVKIFNADTDELETVLDLTADMFEGNVLTIDFDPSLIKDETNYYVVVEEGAFGDNATVQNHVFEFGGPGVWEFSTGDNTPPNPVAISPVPDTNCLAADFVLELTFDENYGVMANEGTITLTDDEGEVLAVYTQDDLEFEDEEYPNFVTLAISEMPDNTEITVVLSEGLFIDIVGHLNDEMEWNIATGDNTAPVVVDITPELAETADTVITIVFSEPVNVESLEGEATLVGGTEEVTLYFTSTDSITYTADVSGLDAIQPVAGSATVYQVVFAEGSFVDQNEGCSEGNSIEADSYVTFEVLDMIAPIATGYPTASEDFRDVVLSMVFDSEVVALEGELHIFDAVEDTLVMTLSVEDLTTADNITFETPAVDLYYGEFYVLVDEDSFEDEAAADMGQMYEGIADADYWTIDIRKTSFYDDCITKITPVNGSVIDALNTSIVVEFCDERVIMPAVRANRVVSVATTNSSMEFIVTEDMIEGNTLTIEVEGLEENTTYSIYFQSGSITDEYGNEFDGRTDASWWTFTTPDFTAPTLVSVNPESGEDMPETFEVVLTFSKDVEIPAGALTVSEGTVQISGSGAVYTATITADQGATVVLTVSDAVVDMSGNNFEGAEFTYTIVDPIPVVTIAEIQGTGDATPYEGQVVTTTGVVTAVRSNGFYIQDDRAVRSGIFVYAPDFAGDVALGNGVQVTGNATEYFEVTQLNDVSAVEFISPNSAARSAITPIVIEASEMGEDYESVLVTIDMLKTTELPDQYGEWMTQTDEGDEVKIDEYLYEFVPDLGQRYNITGILNYSHNWYKLAPRMLSDIEIVTSVLALDLAIEVYPNPFDNFISIDASNQLDITKAVITNITGQLVKEVYRPGNRIETSELRSGIYVISLHTEDGVAKTQRIVKR